MPDEVGGSAESRLSQVTSSPGGVPAAPYASGVYERVVLPSGPRAAANSPFAAMIGGEEALRVRVWCGTFGAAPGTVPSVDVAFRFLGADGRRQLTVTSITPTTDRLVNSRTIPLAAGAIEDLTVQWTGASTLTGLCYVTVEVQRGVAPGATRTVAQLAGGYVKPAQGLAWPGASVSASLDGAGYQRAAAATVPAAGAQPLITQPTGTIWRPVSLTGILVTDATGSIRVPSAVLLDAAAVEICRVRQGDIGGSRTAGVTWSPGLPNSGTGNGSYTGLPVDVMLRGGGSITTVTQNMQAADQWSSFAAYIEEWLEAAL